VLVLGCYSPELSGPGSDASDAPAGVDGPGACGSALPPPGCANPIWLPCEGCHLECENEETWFVAHNECSQQIGGHLVILETLQENDCVALAMRADEAWTGLVQDAAKWVDGGWRWSDGTALSYVGWASGEPDDQDGTEDGAEDRAVLHALVGWIDLDGDVNLSAFVCEFD
jgi:hypothetical protein